MKTRLVLLAFVMLSMTTLSFSSTETNAASSELRLINQNFYGIVLNGNATVYMIQGETNSVRVVGSKQNLSDVKTSISEGALVINSGNLRNVDIYVTMPDVDLLQVNGNGVIHVKSTISADMLLMKVVGSGIISADVRALSVGMIIHGNGRIYVRGITGDSFTKIKGNGKVIAMNLDKLRDHAAQSVSMKEDNLTLLSQ